MATLVIVLNGIAHPEHRRNGWRLCLQWARYQYDNKSEPETGYRFIWRRPGGSLQPARGQARIPALSDAERLIQLARELGWGDLSIYQFSRHPQSFGSGRHLRRSFMAQRRPRVNQESLPRASLAG